MTGTIRRTAVLLVSVLAAASAAACGTDAAFTPPADPNVLQFRVVLADVDPSTCDPGDAPYPPPAEEAVLCDPDAPDGPRGYRLGPAEMNAADIAAVGSDRSKSNPGQNAVTIEFDTEGTAAFQRLTAANIGERLAISVGVEVITAPIIQEAIAGGTVVITSTMTADEAADLADRIAAAAGGG